jgi:hypothetical protein
MTPQRFFSFNRASTVFSSVTPGTFSGDLAYALPELRYAGADPSLLTQVAAWATQTWPAFNWVADLNTSCEVKDSGSSYSPIICP